MTSLRKSIIDKIKKENIKPIPRFYFILIHILLLILILFAIFLGALSVSIIIAVINGVEWEVVHKVTGMKFASFLMILPYLWFLVLGVVVFVAGKLFERLKMGYRYSHFFVAIGVVVLSIFFGLILYFMGVGNFTEGHLTDNFKPYERWSEIRDRSMVAPDNGVLVGKVIDIESDKEVIIIDFLRDSWEVDVSDALFVKDFELQLHKPVSIFGERTGAGEFKAEKIMPWRKGGMRKNRSLPSVPLKDDFEM